MLTGEWAKKSRGYIPRLYLVFLIYCFFLVPNIHTHGGVIHAVFEVLFTDIFGIFQICYVTYELVSRLVLYPYKSLFGHFSLLFRIAHYTNAVLSNSTNGSRQLIPEHFILLQNACSNIGVGMGIVNNLTSIFQN